ncbi:MAG: ureidoglycolate lyase [Planctomycetia bacterium]|nr:ureidoglycolate lyase [Planctomycetia bacterium]
MNQIILNAERATASSVAPFGCLVDQIVSDARLPIPFYPHVDEGINLPFEHTGRAVIRTARVFPTNMPVRWLERHLNLTQFFLGLGSADFALVLAKPDCHPPDGINRTPDLSSLRCFVFNGGTGIVLSKGIWHDFPIAIHEPVTCLIANSFEVIQALIQIGKPAEMDQGDVFKINLPTRLGCEIIVRSEND